jgi:hypothetical protein
MWPFDVDYTYVLISFLSVCVCCVCVHKCVCLLFLTVVSFIFLRECKYMRSQLPGNLVTHLMDNHPLLPVPYHIANFRVQSAAVLSCSGRLVLTCCAISGISGSSGLGSVSRDEMESRTLEMVSAGLQLSFRMSKHIPPCALMLQWYTLVSNWSFGGLNG